MKSNSKQKRGDAERAARWYAHTVQKCVLTIKAIRSKWQSQDMFGADIVGKRADGTYFYAQVTAGKHQAVTARRRKLEKIPWHKEVDTVELLQLIQTEDPANARRKLWFFRIHWYDTNDHSWHTKDEAFPIPKEWFKAWKGETIR